MSRNGILRLAFLVAVAGVFVAATAEAAGPFNFFSVTPCRIVDTRKPAGVTGGPIVTAGTQRNFPISAASAACGVPTTATAATLNVTLVNPSAAGFVKIWPFGSAEPLVSTINAAAHEPAIANGAIVPLGSDATFQISLKYGTAPPPGATAHVIIDVTGYFQ
jgi:hypothetical protein